MRKPLVLLDPGHGGWDTGIRTESICEKDINLAVCLELRQLLEAAGVEVGMTRYDDREMTVNKRTEIANDLEVDLFVSWHCDGLSDSTVYGVSLWVAEETHEVDSWMSECEVIGEEICAATGQILLGVFQDHEKVLQGLERPAVLIKGAFLTNPQEQDRCTQPEFLKGQAIGAAKGILQVLNKR